MNDKEKALAILNSRISFYSIRKERNKSQKNRIQRIDYTIYKSGLEALEYAKELIEKI